MCTGITVDREYFQDLSIEEQRNVLHKLLDRCSDTNLSNLAFRLMENLGEYKYLYTCKDCGDSVIEYTLEI